MKRWLKRWALSIAMCLVILVTATVSLVLWLGSGNDGAVHVGTPAATTVKAAPADPIEVATSYFIAQLPAGFKVTRQVERPDATSLLQLAADSEHQEFAVTIAPLPVGGLSNASDYALRIKQPAAYQPISLPNLPSGATAFRTTAGDPSLSVFWPHGSEYASIGFTGDGNNSLDQLEVAFAQVLASWQW